MRRGDIVLVDLDPAQGSESRNRRPAVVVSADGANAAAERLGRGVVTIVPITSNVARVYPFQLALPAEETGLDRASKAQAEQVRSVDVGRLSRPVGRMSTTLMSGLDDCLRLHLDL